MRERVRVLERSAYSGKTKSARSTQEKRYLNFCEKFSVPPFSPTVRDIVMYIAYLSFWMVYASVVNYLAGVNNFLRAHRAISIDYTDYHIKRALRGLRKVSAKGRGKARPLFPQDLLRMFGVLDLSKGYDLLFWSAVTLGYRCLFRISNLCGPHALRACNVKFVSKGLVIYVTSSKTNQFGDYCNEIVVVKNPATPLCPVGWLERVFAETNPLPSDRIYRLMDKVGSPPMTYDWFRRKLLSVVDAAGLGGTGVSTHSLRRGSTSFMKGVGYDLCDVKRRGGWSSNTVLEYIEELPGEAWDKDKLFAENLL